ncbi:MAG: hypothetical protein R2746_10950 [Acidimicrobiales bacterium]
MRDVFRKKAKPAPPKDADEMRARMARVQPALDARLASGEETDPLKLTQMLVARALTRLAEDDRAGALEDADAAWALGVTTPDQDRACTVALAEAVKALGLADRREEALARLQAVDLEPLEPARRHLFGAHQVHLLLSLGRPEEAREVMRAVPMVVEPGPGYAERLLARAAIRITSGDPNGSLEDVDAALAAGLAAERTRVAANLGAYAIAVLGGTDRLDEALAWANLACTPGLDGAEAGLAERDTRASVLAVAGRGAEAIADLETGLARLSDSDPTDPAVGWSHAFLARANLDAGQLGRARHHTEQAVAAQASTPVLDDVRRRLSGGPPAPA